MSKWNQLPHDEILDKENQLKTEKLSQKISRLKNLAFEIETETKEHNSLLDNVDNDFDGSAGLLSGSSFRIGQILSRDKTNRKVMCYVSGGLVAIFFVCYYLVFIRAQR